ncbi:hypothetical protein XOCgx_0948 [Xanthomonas oryzae pv. oryzicola]|nr:hypothetical protein XOCgx_0948 [Xanthomonas oryzae pv. oryzicola]
MQQTHGAQHACKAGDKPLVIASCGCVGGPRWQAAHRLRVLPAQAREGMWRVHAMAI